jgi:hypothetical protein
MENTPNPHKKNPSGKAQQKPRSGKTEALIIGLILAIVGSIVAGSFEKGTLTNYAGFGMLLAGITAVVAGACSLVSSGVADRLQRENPELCRGKRRLPLCTSIWAIGVGVVLAVIGSLLASTYDRALLLNTAGFGMLLTGISVSVLGLSSAALGTVRIELNRNQKAEVKTPKMLIFDVVSLGLGVVFLVVGSIVAGSYSKETLLNYAGFGMLIFGIAILSLGASGTAVAMLKARLYPDGEETDEYKPRMLFGSIWAIGIGVMLLITGSLLAATFEKNSLMNFAGFGLLLSGAGVFVYGLFETAKASAMGYLNYRNSSTVTRHSRKLEKPQETLLSRLKSFWLNLVRTSAVLNLSGVIIAVCILFFSLWQLDLIVSGPVWYSNPDGSGWNWHGPGPYADNYFQCFFWKTTIGQAYDTLFMLIFISFVVMFASAYFWPRQNVQPHVTLKLKGGEMPAKKRRRRKRKPSAEAATTPVAPTESPEDKTAQLP